jgi:hypothetical protein
MLARSQAFGTNLIQSDGNPAAKVAGGGGGGLKVYHHTSYNIRWRSRRRPISRVSDFLEKKNRVLRNSRRYDMWYVLHTRTDKKTPKKTRQRWLKGLQCNTAVRLVGECRVIRLRATYNKHAYVADTANVSRDSGRKYTRTTTPANGQGEGLRLRETRRPTRVHTYVCMYTHCRST